MSKPNPIFCHHADHIEQQSESQNLQVHPSHGESEGASTEKGILARMVLESQRSLSAAGNQERDFSKWSLNELIEYIVRSHHDYIREEMPRLHSLTERVLAARKWLNPELIELARKLRRLSGDLTFHMSHCENKVFPYIEALELSVKDGTPLGSASSPQTESLIEEVMVGHAPAGELLREIETDTCGFTPPEDASPDMISLFEGLKELARRRGNHVQLEGYILFPRALALEKQVLLAPGI